MTRDGGRRFLCARACGRADPARSNLNEIPGGLRCDRAAHQPEERPANLSQLCASLMAFPSAPIPPFLTLPPFPKAIITKLPSHGHRLLVKVAGCVKSLPPR